MPISAPNTFSKPDQNKILYIDHLKVMLTALVILHHACVTYGGPGSWYYSEKTSSQAAIIPMTIFVATNQAFFMGFFFFLSSLFIPASLNRKGAATFIKDRLIRLGIPLLFYSFILSPIMNYLVYYYAGGHHITFIQFLSGYDGWISFGVMWFVVALLLFTGIYIIYHQNQPDKHEMPKIPSLGNIVTFAFCLGVFSFLVRIIFPVGWVLRPFGFQLGHFPQYLALFSFGIIAWNNRWLEQLDAVKFRRAPLLALCMIVFGFPIIYTYKILFGSDLAWFSGGMHVESLMYSIWEQVTGFTIITTLLFLGKKRWNRPSAWLAKLSRSSFAVYVLHPLVLISLSLLIKNSPIDPAMKFLIVGPAGVLLTFALGNIVVKIPYLNRIF